MRTGWLRLSRACNNACRFCCESEQLDGAPVALDALRAELERMHKDGVELAILSGGEPTLSPHLLDVIRYASQLGMKTRLATNGRALTRPERIDALVQAGLSELWISVHSCNAAVHDALVGAPGALRQTLLALKLAARAQPALRVVMRVVVTRSYWGDLGDTIELGARLGVSAVELRRLEPLGRGASLIDAERSAPEQLVEAIERAQRMPVRLLLTGFDAAFEADAAASEPRLLDDMLLAGLRAGLVRAPAGVRVTRADSGAVAAPLVERDRAWPGLGVELAALQAPALDLPRCWSGRGAASPEHALKTAACKDCPLDARCAGLPRALQAQAHALGSCTWPRSRPRSAIVIDGDEEDGVYQLAALPQLVHALRAAGLQVTFLSARNAVCEPWEAMIGRGVYGANVEQQLRARPALDADLIVCTGYGQAADLVERRSRPDTQLVIVDFHMLSGADRFAESCRARSRAGTGPAAVSAGFPERVTIHSAFPGYLALYRNYGIPLDRIVFQPYLAPIEVFPLGPDPLACATMMSGGNHLRDLDCLQRAIAGVAPRLQRDVHVYSPQPGLIASPRFAPLGYAEFPDFWKAIQNSRCVVLPLADVPNKAAGITVIVLALAAGRPVIASNIPAARDYLRDGVDSLLVPPGDAEALGAALLRLDRDDALLARLAAGAREARERLSAARWARTLLEAPQPRADLRPW